MKKRIENLRTAPNQRLRDLRFRSDSMTDEMRIQAKFGHLGERAVAMALVCRQKGLRDLVVPWAEVAECIPSLADFAQAKRYCCESAWGRSTCREESVVLIVTESGFKGGYCEKHAELRVVRLVKE